MLGTSGGFGGLYGGVWGFGLPQAQISAKIRGKCKPDVPFCTDKNRLECTVGAVFAGIRGAKCKNRPFAIHPYRKCVFEMGINIAIS